jgi:hypothetical protein
MVYRWVKSKLWIFDVGFARMERKTGETAPGWAPHMLVFCVIALVIGGASQLGLQIQWLALPLFTIDFVTSYATQRLVRKSWLRLGRMGCLGLTRARWWIELAGLACTLTMAFGVSGMAHGVPGVQFPGAKWIHSILYNGSRFSAAIFLLTGTIGMLMGVAQQKPVHGRSLELVACFYWSFLIMGGLCMVPDAWLIPLVGVLFATGCLVAVIVYADQLENGIAMGPPNFAQRQKVTENENSIS